VTENCNAEFVKEVSAGQRLLKGHCLNSQLTGLKAPVSDSGRGPLNETHPAKLLDKQNWHPTEEQLTKARQFVKPAVSRIIDSI
jgi:hypothetical protein